MVEEGSYDPSCPVHHQKHELSEELLSIQSLVPLVDTSAPARCVMFAGHFSQHLTISGSEPTLVQTGVEEEFGKYTFKIKMPEDGVIVQVIPRYAYNQLEDDPSMQDNQPAEVVVIYQSEATGNYGVFTVPYFCSHSPQFGFKYDIKQPAEQLFPGMQFPKDTVFADTPAVKGESHYTYTKNLNICYMSHPNVGLDGYVIAESALEYFKFKIYERRVVEFGSNSFLINLHGTTEKYKAYPDVGDWIREDGLLAISRAIDPLEFPSSFSLNDVGREDHLFDRATYSRPGKGRVVDLVVTQSTNSNRVLAPEMIEQTERYARKHKRFNQEFVDFYNRTSSQWLRQNPGCELNPELYSTELSMMIVTAMAVTNQKTGYPQPLSLNFKSRPIDTWRVEFTIEYEFTPTRGSKFTCQSGGKGVVCLIEKDENMPVDADGNRAQIISGPDSIPGRMNLPRLYIPYIAGCARDVRREILEQLGLNRYFDSKLSIEELASIPEDRINTAIGTLLDYYQIISKTSYREFTEVLTEEERFLWLQRNVINGPLYTHVPISTEGKYPDLIHALDDRFKTTYGPVSYVAADGTRVTTKNKFRIAPIPIMLLDKIADQWLAADIGKLSNFGVVTAMNEQDKNTRPYRKTSARVISETEGRLYAAYGGSEFIQELIARSADIASQHEVGRQILNAENPADIDQIIDRNKIPLGSNRPLQITNSFLLCIGIEIVYEEEDLE